VVVDSFLDHGRGVSGKELGVLLEAGEVFTDELLWLVMVLVNINVLDEVEATGAHCFSSVLNSFLLFQILLLSFFLNNFDVLVLPISEFLHDLVVGGYFHLHPGMVIDLRHCGSLSWVKLKDGLNQVFEFC
jgi:hypothetical protein